MAVCMACRLNSGDRWHILRQPRTRTPAIQATVLHRVQTQLATFDAGHLQAAARQYGTERTRKQVATLLAAQPAQA